MPRVAIIPNKAQVVARVAIIQKGTQTAFRVDIIDNENEIVPMAARIPNGNIMTSGKDRGERRELDCPWYE